MAIIRAAKFATNLIAGGQPSIYGFTISVHSPDGEAIVLKNVDVDSSTLSAEDKITVENFLTLMAEQLV